MAEQADAHDSNSCSFGSVGSIPTFGTFEKFAWIISWALPARGKGLADRETSTFGRNTIEKASLFYRHFLPYQIDPGRFLNGMDWRDIKNLDHVLAFLDNSNNEEQTEYDHELDHDAGVYLSFQYTTVTTLQMIDRNLFFRIGVVSLHAG